MGMYTELIFGARLKRNTPKEVIDTLKYMVGDLEEKPEKLAFETSTGRNVLRGSSYFFGVHSPVSKFYYDDIAEAWTLSSRANIKNYEGEIDQFLDWIKPYIDSGSGNREMFAIKIYEEQDEPTIYYLHDSVKTGLYSAFYGDFCELYGLNSNNIKKNTIKSRYELNKLVKQSLLEKSSTKF